MRRVRSLIRSQGEITLIYKPYVRTRQRGRRERFLERESEKGLEEEEEMERKDKIM